ncbi:interaptin-like [Mya arenaria]|uniref:interaptin-like n=1 Tax=Mya arenaria TaxID=6604 RepID=UPI0022E471AD|nr:interaptin-like [Mya arenaria]
MATDPVGFNNKDKDSSDEEGDALFSYFGKRKATPDKTKEPQQIADITIGSGKNEVVNINTGSGKPNNLKSVTMETEPQHRMNEAKLLRVNDKVEVESDVCNTLTNGEVNKAKVSDNVTGMLQTNVLTSDDKNSNNGTENALSVNGVVNDLEKQRKDIKSELNRILENPDAPLVLGDKRLFIISENNWQALCDKVCKLTAETVSGRESCTEQKYMAEGRHDQDLAANKGNVQSSAEDCSGQKYIGEGRLEQGLAANNGNVQWSAEEYSEGETFPGVNFSGVPGKFIRKNSKLVFERYEQTSMSDVGIANSEMECNVSEELRNGSIVENDTSHTDAFDVNDSHMIAIPLNTTSNHVQTPALTEVSGESSTYTTESLNEQVSENCCNETNSTQQQPMVFHFDAYGNLQPIVESPAKAFVVDTKEIEFRRMSYVNEREQSSSQLLMQNESEVSKPKLKSFKLSVAAYDGLMQLHSTTVNDTCVLKPEGETEKILDSLKEDGETNLRQNINRITLESNIKKPALDKDMNMTVLKKSIPKVRMENTQPFNVQSVRSVAVAKREESVKAKETQVENTLESEKIERNICSDVNNKAANHGEVESIERPNLVKEKKKVGRPRAKLLKYKNESKSEDKNEKTNTMVGTAEGENVKRKRGRPKKKDVGNKKVDDSEGVCPPGETKERDSIEIPPSVSRPCETTVGELKENIRVISIHNETKVKEIDGKKQSSESDTTSLHCSAGQEFDLQGKQKRCTIEASWKSFKPNLGKAKCVESETDKNEVNYETESFLNKGLGTYGSGSENKEQTPENSDEEDELFNYFESKDKPLNRSQVSVECQANFESDSEDEEFDRENILKEYRLHAKKLQNEKSVKQVKRLPRCTVSLTKLKITQHTGLTPYIIEKNVQIKAGLKSNKQNAIKSDVQRQQVGLMETHKNTKAKKVAGVKRRSSLKSNAAGKDELKSVKKSVNFEEVVNENKQYMGRAENKMSSNSHNADSAIKKKCGPKRINEIGTDITLKKGPYKRKFSGEMEKVENSSALTSDGTEGDSAAVKGRESLMKINSKEKVKQIMTKRGKQKLMKDSANELRMQENSLSKDMKENEGLEKLNVNEENCIENNPPNVLDKPLTGASTDEQHNKTRKRKVKTNSEVKVKRCRVKKCKQTSHESDVNVSSTETDNTEDERTVTYSDNLVKSRKKSTAVGVKTMSRNRKMREKKFKDRYSWKDLLPLEVMDIQKTMDEIESGDRSPVNVKKTVRKIMNQVKRKSRQNRIDSKTEKCFTTKENEKNQTRTASVDSCSSATETGRDLSNSPSKKHLSTSQCKPGDSNSQGGRMIARKNKEQSERNEYLGSKSREVKHKTSKSDDVHLKAVDPLRSGNCVEIHGSPSKGESQVYQQFTFHSPKRAENQNSGMDNTCKLSSTTEVPLVSSETTSPIHSPSKAADKVKGLLEKVHVTKKISF